MPGTKYANGIRNASGARVLAVTSVDGVNVVSGETARVTQTGYVFGAWQRYGITGWRKSNNDVAAFEFTASPNSYAEHTGRPRDVGVIGVALFKERALVGAGELSCTNCTAEFNQLLLRIQRSSPKNLMRAQKG